MHHEIRVWGVPRVIRQAGRIQVVAVTESCRGSGAGRVFPLCFGRKPIRGACGNSSRCEFLLRQLRAVISCVHPAHTRNRPAQVAREKARVCSYYRQIFTLGHFIFPNPKSASDNHRGLRAFIDSAVKFIRRAAHSKSVRRNEDHVRRRILQRRPVEPVVTDGSR